MKKTGMLWTLFLILANCGMTWAQKPKAVTPVPLPSNVKVIPQEFKPSSLPNSTPRPPVTGPAVDNSAPEPSALYGYITLTDPASGQHYLGDQNGPPRGLGLTLRSFIVFRRTANPSQTFTLARSDIAVARWYRNPSVAGWYWISLMQDATAGDTPVYFTSDKKVHYDPTKWRFKNIEMGPLSWMEIANTGATTMLNQDISPVAPIGEFPNFSDGGDRGGPPY
jgi:hypothetical protein